MRLGHLLASSCRTSRVIRSHGSSKYLRLVVNRFWMSFRSISMLGMRRPDISGLRLTMDQSRLSWAIILHFLLTTENFIISLCRRKEKILRRTLSGKLSIQDISFPPPPILSWPASSLCNEIHSLLTVHSLYNLIVISIYPILSCNLY